VCMGVDGDGGHGSPCARDHLAYTDTCDATSYCWSAVVDDLPKPGTCRALCDYPNAPECPAGTYCALGIEDASICLDLCDPLSQDCLAGQTCAWLGQEFVCLEVPGDGPTTGEPCGYANDCESGTACVPALAHESCPGAGCCAPFCNLDGPDPCGAGTACAPLVPVDEAPPEQTAIGVCALPEWQSQGPHSTLVATEF
jgi:hypothetical protein